LFKRATTLASSYLTDLSSNVSSVIGRWQSAGHSSCRVVRASTTIGRRDFAGYAAGY